MSINKFVSAEQAVAFINDGDTDGPGRHHALSFFSTTSGSNRRISCAEGQGMRLVLETLGRVRLTQVGAARLMLLRAAWEIDQGRKR